LGVDRRGDNGKSNHHAPGDRSLHAQSPVGSLPRRVQGVPIRTCRQERGLGHYHGTDVNNLALAFLTRYLLAPRKYRIELRF
jgi:hypothetical protein